MRFVSNWREKPHDAERCKSALTCKECNRHWPVAMSAWSCSGTVLISCCQPAAQRFIQSVSYTHLDVYKRQIVQWALKVPIEGSLALFLAVATLHLFVTTSIGIFMATLARSMPQFGLLIMLVLLPMQMLSGGTTPRESMPILAQNIMQVAPTTHFVAAAQAILYRGAGFDVVWPQVLALIVICLLYTSISMSRP